MCCEYISSCKINIHGQNKQNTAYYTETKNVIKLTIFVLFNGNYDFSFLYIIFNHDLKILSAYKMFH